MFRKKGQVCSSYGGSIRRSKVVENNLLNFVDIFSFFAGNPVVRFFVYVIISVVLVVWIFDLQEISEGS